MKKYDHTWLIAEWQRMGRPDVEYLSPNLYEWHTDTDPVFYDDVQYRIKSKPWINWEHVSEKFNALAVDEQGAARFYSSRPVLSVENSIWLTPHYGSSMSVSAFASFTPGTCAWQDSLVMRHVVIGEEK